MTERTPPGDEDRLLDEALGAWAPLSPPTGFADRLADLVTEPQAESAPPVAPEAPPAPSAPRWGRWLAAAGLLLAVGGLTQIERPDAGEVTTSARRELALSEGVRAVAEPGAALSWSVGWGGRTAVHQREGKVFYRVSSGTPMQVSTPAGAITVHGTCFTVEVSPMGAQRSRTLKHTLAGALGGAAITAAALVTVYEGQVEVSSAGAQARLAPGERAALVQDRAPIRAVTAPDVAQLTEEKAALEKQVEALRADMAALRREARARALTPTAPGHATDVEAEAERLRKQVEVLQEALNDEQDMRNAREGDAFPFPDDLPEAYREAGLKAAFTELLAAEQIHGRITEIDCSEYPCVVHGEAEEIGGDRTILSEKLDALEEGLGARYPKEEANHATSVWGTTVKDEETGEPIHRNRFSVSIYPKEGHSEADNDAIRKRLRFRNEQHREGMIP